MHPLQSSLSGKAACVTGGMGMVGQHLVSKLLEWGVTVYVMDDASRGSTKVDGAHYIVADATKETSCLWAFRRFSTSEEPVDIVFNLAASVAGVLHNMNHHHQMFLDNVQLQTVPLKVAEFLNIPYFLQVSSVCVYAPEYNAPSQEEQGLLGDPHPANGGYAWSKRMGEKMLSLSSIKNRIAVRPSNIYGIGDYFDDRAHVIPALIKRAYEPGDEMVVYGDPSVTREFIYAEDAARGMAYALAKGQDGEVYNVGRNGDDISIGALAELILEISGQNKRIVFDGTQGGGDERRYSNSEKLMNLGWNPTIGLEEGLIRTIRWYETTHLNQ